MTDLEKEKIGRRISTLRKERGYTGEALAERLCVSPQAISKWENAKCLPETAVLPELAEALDCSIDSLLCPKELLVLEAVYTDGQTGVSVTRILNDMVCGSRLTFCVNPSLMGASIESDRLKILTVKYETSEGIYYSYAVQNENLILDRKSISYTGEKNFQIIGAYYGNEKGFSSCMQKMEHYEYFKWDRIEVSHEVFPSNPASDDTEYLTLVYLNGEGIHVISCPENDAIYYGGHGTQLLLQDHSRCMLDNVMRFTWTEGTEESRLECTWAGSLYAALKYMGEAYTYDQIMGMSGACYRICFTDVWDYSCMDALVAYDYASPLSDAIGLAFHFVERLEKQERKTERQAIMEDIQNGRPVLAINLRVAPEWGIITGYTDNGSKFLCRTYFDKEVFDDLEQEHRQADRRLVFEENGGYLYSDFWPFIILHLGEKKDRPSAFSILRSSLSTFVKSFRAEICRGYYQGKEAYRAWIEGLSKEEDFRLENDSENVSRRLNVNDNMLCSLIDARYAASVWLQENLPLVSETCRERLEKIAGNCRMISDMLSAFRSRVYRSSTSEIAYNTGNAFGVSTPGLRREQISLLEKALALEEVSCGLAEEILEMSET